MAIVSCSSFAHVRLTVSDIQRSREFYDRVFGWTAAIDTSALVGEAGVTEDPQRFYGGVVYSMPGGTLLGLRPVAPDEQRFDSTRTGLDHLSFMVDTRDDLVAAHQALEEAGIAHGEIIDLEDAGLAILSFQDPDDINLELTALLS